MAFSKIIFNGTTLMDVTQKTVDSSNLLYNETALGADGEGVVGAYVQFTLSLDADGNLYAVYDDQSAAPVFDIDENGDLYYVV